MAAMNELQTEHSPATVTPLSDSSKTIKTNDFTSNNDSISRLPDEILTHILSFLTTESSVATSALSTRWYHLWSLVPTLDFGSKGRINPCSCPVKIAQFVNFIDRRVLFIKNVLSVRKVRLRCFNDWEVSLVINWINVLVTREAEIFDLCLPYSFVDDSISPLYSVPASFFNQKNLVDLKLKYVVLKVPPFVCFPSLEIICFKSVYFIDDCDEGSMENLLSGCPVLSCLCIIGGFSTSKKTLSICSSTLRDLVLDNMFDDDDKDFGFKVVIDAPNLRYINLRDVAGTVFDISNVSSLVRASLCIEVSFENPVLYGKRLLALLHKISRVKELFLKTSTIGSFHDLHRYWFGILPMFENLTLLDVELLCGSWWPNLPRLLHYTPNLVNFFIFVECDRGGYEPHELPQCLLSSLENVEIVHQRKNSVQMELICYILGHAKVLKRLSIQTRCLKLENEANLIEKLHKNSGACQIEYKNMEMFRDEIISSYHIGETNESNKVCRRNGSYGAELAKGL